MLPSSELDAMRSDYAASFPDTCEVQAEATGSDGQGGTTSAGWTTLSTPKCAVEDTKRRGAVEQVVASGVVGGLLLDVHLPFGTDARAGHRIVWQGKKLHVLSSLEDSYALERLALATEDNRG